MKPPKGQLTRVQMDAIADVMAGGCRSVSEAGRRLGMSQRYVDKLWQRIRRDLGPQAS